MLCVDYKNLRTTSDNYNLPFRTDQGVEGLGCFLNGLVESLRGTMAVSTENLVLSKEHTLCKKKFYQIT